LGDPVLADYYEDEEKLFEQTFSALHQLLPHHMEAGKNAIQPELN